VARVAIVGIERQGLLEVRDRGTMPMKPLCRRRLAKMRVDEARIDLKSACIMRQCVVVALQCLRRRGDAVFALGPFGVERGNPFIGGDRVLLPIGRLERGSKAVPIFR
jgi:hypothetical protein